MKLPSVSSAKHGARCASLLPHSIRCSTAWSLADSCAHRGAQRPPDVPAAITASQPQVAKSSRLCERNGRNFFAPLAASRRAIMPERPPNWREEALSKLADSKLSRDEREEISRELAGYLEDFCASAPARDLDDRAATESAAAELREDKYLGAT